MNDPRIPALLVSHRRPGFYFRVLEEGEVQAGDEIVKVASGPEQMTVAEVDALLYLPGHPRQQLLRALRIPALSPGWQASFRALLDGERRCRQRRPGRHEPASGLARVPPADRRRDRARERLRDLDPPRGPRRRSAPRGAPGPVPHAANPARERAAIGAPELLAVGTARRRLLPHHRQAGARRHRQRLSPHPARRRRPARRRSAAWHVHPRPDARARAADQRRHRRDAGPRHAPRTGGGAFRSGDLVAARRAQSDATTPSRPRRARSSLRSRTSAATSTTAVPARTTAKAATSTAQAVSPRRCSPSSTRRATPRHTCAVRRRSWRRSAPAWPRSASTPPTSTPSRSDPRPA